EQGPVPIAKIQSHLCTFDQAYDKSVEELAVLLTNLCNKKDSIIQSIDGMYQMRAKAS
ncbi:unnamed protein product, partial [Heterosigma akashiwo]